MPQLAFYRKYRPKTFSEAINQKLTIQILTNAIKGNKISHAYLFAGPRGTGKTTFARLFAKAINCEKRKEGEYEPCNQCSSCSDINENRSLDLIEIDAASNRGIDEIRNLREGIKFAPVKSKYKVYIVDEAHQITKDAFNALLKTLEEPPAYAIFILATTEPEKLPATILSRVQRYDFKKLSLEDTIKRLAWISQQEKLEVTDEALRMIALSSEGGLRDAESLLGQLAIIKNGKITLEDVELLLGSVNFQKIRVFIDFLIEKNAAEAIRFINQLNEEGYNLMELSKGIINYLRYLLIIKVSGSLIEMLKQEVTDEEAEILKKQAEKVKVEDLRRYLDKFLEQQYYINRSLIPVLPLELAIVESLQL